jgi:hypothetical protein
MVFRRNFIKELKFFSSFYTVKILRIAIKVGKSKKYRLLKHKGREIKILLGQFQSPHKTKVSASWALLLAQGSVNLPGF